MAMIDEHYVSIEEAARLLKVGKSTLWRWVSQGDLHAYRLGRRRVLIKRQDLDRLITPLYGEKGAGRASLEQEGLGPLTEIEQKIGLEALAKLRVSQEEMLRQRSGALFPDAAEDLHKLREQRTRQLR